METKPKKNAGVPPNATQAVIKKAYRRLARQYHPDRNTNSIDRFHAVRRAYKALADPKAFEEESRNNPLRVGFALPTWALDRKSGGSAAFCALLLLLIVPLRLLVSLSNGVRDTSKRADEVRCLVKECLWIQLELDHFATEITEVDQRGLARSDVAAYFYELCTIFIDEKVAGVLQRPLLSSELTRELVACLEQQRTVNQEFLVAAKNGRIDFASQKKAAVSTRLLALQEDLDKAKAGVFDENFDQGSCCGSAACSGSFMKGD
eukprot:TRINITY_DN5416_c0_g1_i2.p1 TRINITY_DN5416_c0_g1~~TRINITY_DN5416_c0_g1_i2.p1  ORF type:complete len:263 (+),score=35.28 TRINITY_DN5416_c0_g1_i2:479-1267(+)